MMGNIMIGRCYVECWQDQDYTRPAITINFLNRKQAKSFSYHWTKRNGYFTRIYEFQEPDYNNGYKYGYHWICSYRKGNIVATDDYYYYERVRDGVLSADL